MSEKGPVRIPLLWLLLPLIAGILLGYWFPSGHTLPYYGVSLICAAFAYVDSRKLPNINLTATQRGIKQSDWKWKMAITLCGLLMGYAHFLQFEMQGRIRVDLPIREANLTLEIEQLFRSPSNRWIGLGTITSSPQHLHDLHQSTVYFSLYTSSSDAEFTYSPEIGGMIFGTGALRSITSDHSIDKGFQSYLKHSGVAFVFDRGAIISYEPPLDGWTRRLHATLEKAKAALGHGIDPHSPLAHSYTGMLLGLKGELNANQKDVFLRSGALHLFAISGLHIGMIAACGHAFLLFLRFPKSWIPVPNLLMVLSFVMITGGAPSAWRAFLMTLCYYLCIASKRESASLNALVLSALICLFINPLQLFLAGFQMSYFTVSAILLYGVPLTFRLQERWKPFAHVPQVFWSWNQRIVVVAVRFLIGGFAISLSAFLASSVLSIIYFNTLPLIGVLSNIVLLPLASLTIISGFLSLISASIGILPLTSLFNHAALVTLWLMHTLLGPLASLNGSHIQFDAPSISLLYGLLALLMIALLYGYDKRWRFAKRWLWIFPIVFTGACVAAAALG